MRRLAFDEPGQGTAIGNPAVRDTPPMKLYFAGPLFTTPERAWNAEVAAALHQASGRANQSK